MSASWFLVSMYLIWILVSRLIRSKNQSRAALWVLETCLIVDSSLYDHLDHCFIILKDIQQSFLMRRLDVWGNRINILHHIDLPLRFLISLNINRSPCSIWNLRHASKNRNNQIPQFESREARLISIQCPRRWSQILLDCAKRQSVSCTSNLWEQMYDFQKRTMFLQKWILNPQDLPQNQSLQTIPVCTV